MHKILWLKKYLPNIILRLYKYLINVYRSYFLKIEAKKIKINQLKALEKVRNKKKIKVVFFLINVDIWKLDSVYWSLKNASRYEPIVIICPFLSKGDVFLNSELKKGIEFCEKREYDYFLGYNMQLKEAIDIKQIINPDIVFFTNPNNLTSKEFLIDNYLDKLSCFVPYSFRIDRLYNYEYNNRLVNLTWINFYETKIHKKLSKKYAANSGRNVIVSGFPALDVYSTKTELVNNEVWKKSLQKRKKIIWAPHWTIKNYQSTGLDWSCFLDYSEIILDLAIEYKDKIQIAIKPHPLLKTLLEKDSLWGGIKTRKYFEKWSVIENCQFVSGDYKELFEQSDALIHDSGSFMTEYIVLNKPVAYTVSEIGIKDRFNDFGNIVLSGHEIVYNKQDFRRFIENLLNGVDTLKEKRKDIIKKHRLSGHQLIGDKIVNILNRELK